MHVQVVPCFLGVTDFDPYTGIAYTFCDQQREENTLGQYQTDFVLKSMPEYVKDGSLMRTLICCTFDILYWKTFKGENVHEFCVLRATRESFLHEILGVP